MRKMAAIIGLVVSGVIALLGVLVQTGVIWGYDGEDAKYVYFGSENSYNTYIYRALYYSGDMERKSLGMVMIVAGVAGAALSRYGMAAAQESEEQRELMRAILVKMNQAENVGGTSTEMKTATPSPAVKDAAIFAESKRFSNQAEQPKVAARLLHDGWKCRCGSVNSQAQGQCATCGEYKHQTSRGWTCVCGAVSPASKTVCIVCGKYRK